MKNRDEQCDISLCDSLIFYSSKQPEKSSSSMVFNLLYDKSISTIRGNSEIVNCESSLCDALTCNRLLEVVNVRQSKSVYPEYGTSNEVIFPALLALQNHRSILRISFVLGAIFAIADLMSYMDIFSNMLIRSFCSLIRGIVLIC